MPARLSFIFECGATHSSRRARLALRRRVRKSEIGSVMVDVGAYVARVISDSRGPKGLPGGLDDAGDLARECELAELDTGDTKLPDEGARAATHGAAVLHSDG